ncbi:hypothetical protein ACQ4PT_065935 [Festuca glaucescens]
MQQQDPGFGVEKLQREVKTRWLKPREVLNILQNHQLFTVEHRTPQKPPSGSWFLFNRRVHRFFRNDGYGWRKKKSGKTIAEAHERLKKTILHSRGGYIGCLNRLVSTLFLSTTEMF